ncbi:signal recognition particle-docking protein FtsY [Spirochaeta cellobiosiphila]|uniref:signal recognition particle-docking protein FtsY n=1 Tax=Spirochaeta cellobiosiphila TaxID=504483 RepID=UPI00041E0834|nr:signal recognition particle-docking protein FtsY [Spirochaeta cellobiosiphila]
MFGKKKKKSFFDKIKELFGGGVQGEEFFEDFEDLLIEADFGAALAVEIVKEIKDSWKSKKIGSLDEFREAMWNILERDLKVAPLEIVDGQLNLVLVLGVNGVGKTTSIAKMAHYYKKELKDSILLSAGDTFRAAAIEQLQYHGEKLGVRVVAQQHGADPGAVIFDTLDMALARNTKLVIADTAGRMHNKANLVKELQKINKIIQKKAPSAVYKKYLVIDSTTGQNGYRQAEIFNEAVGLDGVILSKYDSTAKGGAAVGISKKLGIPFVFMGLGEKYDDFIPFDKNKFLSGIFDK